MRLKNIKKWQKVTYSVICEGKSQQQKYWSHTKVLYEQKLVY